jgi:single-strand DNA-binding protein
MVNKVILIGRLAADPEVRAAANGTQVAKLRVATNTYGGKNEDGTRREYSDFHNLVVFGQQAEVVGSYLRKGRLVYVEGRNQTRSWDTPEGQRRYATEVVVESFQMLEPKPGEPA